MTLPRRVVLDVSLLPRTVFGVRDMMWWGTLAFVIVEGFSLVLTVAVSLYLRKNFATWPPEDILLPSVVAPTIQMVLMLVSLPVIRRLSQRSMDFEVHPVRRLLTIAALFTITFVALRAWELTQSLNVRWDANAYGSAQWLVVGSHALLLAVQSVETIGMALIFWRGPVEKKHFSDASDIAFYWYFIVLSWLPLYLLAFWLPRWI
ncbi:MAG TPA: cytochrome c oxidase subunit 3 [Gemmatimonadaceae bacterium]|nr:cytochrome c oxidase subunit 3 [Gemmatimonadaceae bacterium]